MSRPRPPDDLLADMIAEGEYAIAFLVGFTTESFKADPRTVRAVLHAVQTVGEAAYHLPPEVPSRAADIPWPKVIRMRHVLVHHYIKVDLDVVWAAVHDDLPGLVQSVRRLRAELSAENPSPAEPPA